MKYEDSNRGKIQFRNRARQIIDYSGLSFENHITPTDIDGLIENHDLKCWVFMEFKCGNAPISKGQRLALERLVDSCGDLRKGHDAILFLCRHNKLNPDEDVVAAETLVTHVYWERQWYSIKKEFRCKEAIDQYFEMRRKCKRQEV